MMKAARRPTASHANSDRGVRAEALAGVLLFLLPLLAYAPALGAGFIWDDDQYVEYNTTLRDPDGLRRIWTEPKTLPQYYPLVFTSFWLEHQLWGLDPAGYHTTNILLHALAGVLLWRVLLRLAVPAAWLIAAVFVLHPVHVESVAWITERKNVLSASLYLAAALAYLRFAPPRSDEIAPARRWRWYGLALVLFLGALLSKTVTATFPAAMLLVLFWQRGRIGGRDVAPLVPFFVLGVGFGLVTAWLEKTRVGASGDDWSFTLAERCLIAGRALWFYASKLVWPADLSFIYPRWQIDATSPLQWLYPLAALAVPVVLAVGRRVWGWGPLVAALYFGGTLLPALGFFDVYPMRFSFVADHFQYLASIGLLALVVNAVAAGVRRLPHAQAGFVLAALILLVLGMLTFAQCFVYTSAETLWTDTLAKNPDAWLAHNEMGLLLYKRDELRAAREQFRASVRLKPGQAASEFNLGRTDLALGDASDAVEHLRAALRLDPAFAAAHDKLGQALVKLGKPSEAVAEFETAARAEPNDAGIAYNLALTLAQLSRREEALAPARRAVQLRPGDDRFRALLDALQTPMK
jgi:tetratricopeptide (TPR) repeat protein